MDRPKSIIIFFIFYLYFFVVSTSYTQPTFIDRYNNSIKINDKTDLKNKTKLQNEENRVVYDIFPFRLVFIQNLTSPNIGFFDTTKAENTTLGEKYRETVCEVYKDLAVLFDKTYLEDTVIINIFSYSNQKENVIAEASPIITIYSQTSETLCSNSITELLVTGVDPYRYFKLKPDAHGYIKYYFNKVNKYSYHYNDNLTENIDLYSITIHETFHLLGVFSFFDVNGYSILGFNVPGHPTPLKFVNKYTLYDKNIIISYDNSYYPLLRNRLNNNYSLNTFKPLYLPFYTLYYKANNRSLKIFNPSNWENGSSIAHLDFDTYCNSDTPYITLPNYSYGQIRRLPHQNEINILKSLGYNLTNEYGLKENINRYNKYKDDISKIILIGKPDFFTANWGDTVKIAIKDLLKNDINAISIANIKFEDDTLYYRGHIKVLNDTISLIPSLNMLEITHISYQPISMKDTGNTTYITIKYCFNRKYQKKGNNCLLNNSHIEYCKGIFPLNVNYKYLYNYPSMVLNDSLIEDWSIYSMFLVGRNYRLLFSDFQQLPDSLSEYGINPYFYNSVKFPFYTKNNLVPTLNNLDTWDADYLNNNIYLSYNYWGNHIISQNMAHELDSNKKFVVDLYIHIEQSIHQYENFYKSFLIYLDFEDPIKSNSFSKILESNDKQILEIKPIRINDWVQIKTKPFFPKQGMKWLALGDISKAQDNLLFRFSLDDIRIREASTSINTYCTNYTPCLGDVVTFTFDIWKDISDDQSDVVLENILPKGFSYIEGDFAQTNGKLLRIVKRNEMDSDGRIKLKISALVEDLPTDSAEVIKNRIILNDGVCNDCIGKTEVILKPALKSFEMKKEFIGPFCDSDTFDVKISIKNLSSKRMKFFRLTEKTHNGFSIPTEFVKINGKPAREQDLFCINERDTTIQNFSFGNHINELISLNDYILSPNNGTETPELVLEYKGIIDKGKDTIELSTIAGSESEGCNLYKYDAFPVNKSIVLPLPESIGFCDTLYLDAKNPGCSYLWSTGETTQKIKVWGESKLMWVNITNSFGCSKTDTLNSYNQNDPHTFYIVEDTISGEPGDNVDFWLKMKNSKFSSDSLYLRGEFITNNKVVKPNLKTDIDYFNVNETDSNYIIHFGQPLKSANFNENFTFRVQNYEKGNTKIKLQNFHWANCSAEINNNDSVLFVMANSLKGTERIYDTTNTGTLSVNYPNPFSESTRIIFTVDKTSTVQITIYDLLGNKVVTLLDGISKPGKYEIEFTPDQGISAGVYNVVVLTNHKYSSFKRQVTRIVYLK